ncbi:hypothetical protein RchiOBHm_Chr5g0026881 [Rosa chinensis]|uniref:Uncharacterized protein n=1 Tax=Rosa chinensis TaxID=74649 RepID=A0A2P6Q8Z4_ROSCH|nr:uncharacterized protein LOC112164609 [Rosa chinensis]PRQ30646.1 hypothetical protein RchiOBHm_Chr5g0026881 [Rosa chinensis]
MENQQENPPENPPANNPEAVENTLIECIEAATKLSSPENQQEENGPEVLENTLVECIETANKLSSLLARALRSHRDLFKESRMEIPVPPEKEPTFREIHMPKCIEAANKLSSLLTRTWFLQGTPISGSAGFASSVKNRLHDPETSTIFNTICSDFPKVHQLMKTHKRTRRTLRFQTLLERDMGVDDLVPRIQKELRSMAAVEVALKGGFEGEAVKERLKKCKENTQGLELEFEILEAIRVPEKKDAQDLDFVAIWGGKEEIEVSGEVLDEWNRFLNEGLDKINNAQEQAQVVSVENPRITESKGNEMRAYTGGKEACQGKKGEPSPVILSNWVRKNQSNRPPVWDSLWLCLTDAVMLGCHASVLLEFLLVSLPESQEGEMKIGQLKAALGKLDKDGRNIAAKRVLELDLFRFPSQNMIGAAAGVQAAAAAAGVQAAAADDRTIYQLKKLFITVNLMFRHPISLGKGDEPVVSLKSYAGQCTKLVNALKQKLRMPEEHWNVEVERMKKSWEPLNVSRPSKFKTVG